MFLYPYSPFFKFDNNNNNNLCKVPLITTFGNRVLVTWR